jgi:hypothetical protein
MCQSSTTSVCRNRFILARESCMAWTINVLFCQIMNKGRCVVFDDGPTLDIIRFNEFEARSR